MPAPIGRPPEIEDLTNRLFFHPLADLVVGIAMRLRLTANLLSMLGLLCGLAAAWTYYHLPQMGYVLAGFVLMLVWHVLDGADGRLARRTGTASATGRVLDGLCDHVTFVAVYIAFTLTLIESGWPAFNAWALAIVAGASHVVQSAGYEARRYQYVRRLRKLRDDNTVICAAHDTSSHGIGMQITTGLASAYEWLQMFWVRPESLLDNKLRELWSDQNNESERHAHRLTHSTRALVKAWSLFNPNKRTFLLAALAAVNLPAVYFVIEITVFNLLLVFLTLCERPYETALMNGLRQRHPA